MIPFLIQMYTQFSGCTCIRLFRESIVTAFSLAIPTPSFSVATICEATAHHTESGKPTRDSFSPADCVSECREAFDNRIVRPRHKGKRSRLCVFTLSDKCRQCLCYP